MNKVYFTGLKGKELFEYFINKHSDKNYSSIVSLLPYATMDLEKAYVVLEDAVKRNEKLIAIYPGTGENRTDDMQFIGSIADGGLYMKQAL
ncbi:MAG: hypothetical protein QM751_08775 [Paludibacteraceae bacterium]